ncbi:phosphoribosylpyrophosphate synthetase [Flavobacteriaceae bacterium Ap0902]|nr:phosphoribosylpyrophosphate synthetase [Flavobacteriaceae bacterium Ap0902]
MMDFKELRNYDTVVEAQEVLRKEGYTYEFDTKDGYIVALGKDDKYTPKDLKILADVRFEGMSNPDDNMILYVIEAKDGTKGTMLDNVGGAESAQDPDLIKAIPMEDQED